MVTALIAIIGRAEIRVATPAQYPNSSAVPTTCNWSAGSENKSALRAPTGPCHAPCGDRMAKLEPFDGCVRGRSNDHRAPMKADQQDLEGGDQDADDGNANGNSGAGLAIGIKADAGKNRPDRRCGQHVICQSRHQGPVDIDRFGVTPHQVTIVVPKIVLLPRGLFRIV